MDEITQAQARLEAARTELQDAEHHLHLAVSAALRRGERATEIAALLGVTRARVYQLRDGRR